MRAVPGDPSGNPGSQWAAARSAAARSPNGLTDGAKVEKPRDPVAAAQPAAALVGRAPALSALRVTVLGLLLVVRSLSDLGLGAHRFAPDSVRTPISTVP